MKLKNFAIKHIYLFTFFILLVSLFCLGSSSYIFSSSDLLEVVLMNLFGRLIPSALLVLIAVCLGIKEEFGIRHHLFKNILICLPLLFVLVAFQLFSMPKDTSFDLVPTLTDLFNCIFTMLCVGIFEEFLLRGVVFNSMKLKWGTNRSGLLRAAITSSLCFGILHLSNLMRTPDLILAVLSQVIYATLFGIYFCGVYVKAKNLWSLVLVHAIIDLIANLPELFSSSLANASKHNPDGTQILVSLTQDAKSCSIDIADTGVPIPEAIRYRLFEPFVLGDQSRMSKNGNGLGLSISKKIIEKHGGRLTLVEDAEELKKLSADTDSVETVSYTKSFRVVLPVSTSSR